MTCKGTVKGNVVVLDEGVSLPEGARVEVRVIESAEEDLKALIDRILANRINRYVGIDEIIEEDKREREERADEWIQGNYRE